MERTISDPVFQAYAASAVAMGINLLYLATLTAVTRTKADEVVNPEDKVLNNKADVVFEAGNDRTARYKRAHRNALENIPLFLISGFLLTLTNVSSTAAAVLFGTFVGARLLHSAMYLSGLQPWRTASFGLGALAQAAILGFLAYGVFFV